MRGGAYGGRQMEVRHAITLALERFSLRLRRAQEAHRNGGRGAVKGPLTAPMSVRDLLWSSVLTKQVRIIAVQGKILSKNSRVTQRLAARNKQLTQQLEDLRRKEEEESRGSRSRCSSLVSSESLPIHGKAQSEYPRHSTVLRTFTIRRTLKPNTNYASHRSNLNADSNSNNASHSSVRKTRASSLPEDLAPSCDFISRRNRVGGNRAEETTRDRRVVLNKWGEVHFENEETQFLLPKIQFHLDDNYLSTQDPDFLPPAIFKQVGMEELGDIPQGNIEVPSWRNKRVDLSRLAGGTEDLDDCVFLRRHLKAEEAEKRRKRWDAQKIREEEYVEQLKERLASRAESRKRFYKAGTKKSSKDGWDDLPWIEPFHPNPKEALFLQVQDEVPINVFGKPLPALPPAEFKLPWTPGLPNSK